MEFRNKIGLGAVQFGLDYGISNPQGMTPISQVSSIMKFALKSGINLIDTAPSYGESEVVIGKTKSITDTYKIVTKINPISEIVICDATLAKIEHDFYTSLVRLKAKNIYGLLFHDANDLRKKGIDKVFNFLLDLKKQKLISKIGISIYDESQINFALTRFQIDLVQLPINVFDQRLHRSGILNKLFDENIEVHARSAFMQGLMFMDVKDVPSKLSLFKPKIRKLRKFSHETGQTIPQIALSYLLRLSEINYVLVGCNSSRQLKEIINCSDNTRYLPDDFLGEISINDTELLNPSKWA